MNEHPTDHDDETFGAFLRRHDPVSPPSAAALAALEDRIMAQIDVRPRRSIPAGLGWLPGMAEQPWALRSAGLLAVLVLALGFVVGRDFSTLSSENTDSAALYASAGGVPWQSFIAAPGETDDNSDESTDDSGE
jgi:hypothetical protein